MSYCPFGRAGITDPRLSAKLSRTSNGPGLPVYLSRLGAPVWPDQ